MLGLVWELLESPENGGGRFWRVKFWSDFLFYKENLTLIARYVLISRRRRPSAIFIVRWLSNNYDLDEQMNRCVLT